MMCDGQARTWEVRAWPQSWTTGWSLALSPLLGHRAVMGFAERLDFSMCAWSQIKSGVSDGADIEPIRLEQVSLTVHVYGLGVAFLSWVLKNGKTPVAGWSDSSWPWLSSKTSPVMGSAWASCTGSLSSAAVCLVPRRPIIFRGWVLGLILLGLGCSEHLPEL